MHNLFLETAKTMPKLWSNRLANKQLEKIEYLIKTIDIPSALVRRPANISANHGSNSEIMDEIMEKILS